MTRERMVLLATLALLAVVTPLVVVLAPFDAVGVREVEPVTMATGDAPELAAALTRPLFAAAASGDAPVDAPALVGIAGRLNVDAVALVRTADGASRTLAVGEAVDGWQLRSLAIDAAFFTRGTQEVRVPLPTGEE